MLITFFASVLAMLMSIASPGLAPSQPSTPKNLVTRLTEAGSTIVRGSVDSHDYDVVWTNQVLTVTVDGISTSAQLKDDQIVFHGYYPFKGNNVPFDGWLRSSPMTEGAIEFVIDLGVDPSTKIDPERIVVSQGMLISIARCRCVGTRGPLFHRCLAINCGNSSGCAGSRLNPTGFCTW